MNNASCSDWGRGTSTQPLVTIKGGGAGATAGTTVIVASGTYTDQVTVTNSGTSTGPIVFAPAAGASVTIRGPTYGFRLSSKSWITIRGFNVTRSTSHGIYVSGSSPITPPAHNTHHPGPPPQHLQTR